MNSDDQEKAMRERLEQFEHASPPTREDMLRFAKAECDLVLQPIEQQKRLAELEKRLAELEDVRELGSARLQRIRRVSDLLQTECERLREEKFETITLQKLVDELEEAISADGLELLGMVNDSSLARSPIQTTEPEHATETRESSAEPVRYPTPALREWGLKWLGFNTFSDSHRDDIRELAADVQSDIADAVKPWQAFLLTECAMKEGCQKRLLALFAGLPEHQRASERHEPSAERAWIEVRHERDVAGNLTPLALAIDSLIGSGCDCGTDELGTCLGCRCEAAIHAQFDEIRRLRDALIASQLTRLRLEIEAGRGAEIKGDLELIRNHALNLDLAAGAIRVRIGDRANLRSLDEAHRVLQWIAERLKDAQLSTTNPEMLSTVRVSPPSEPNEALAEAEKHVRSRALAGDMIAGEGIGNAAVRVLDHRARENAELRQFLSDSRTALYNLSFAMRDHMRQAGCAETDNMSAHIADADKLVALLTSHVSGLAAHPASQPGEKSSEGSGTPVSVGDLLSGDPGVENAFALVPVNVMSAIVSEQTTLIQTCAELKEALIDIDRRIDSQNDVDPLRLGGREALNDIARRIARLREVQRECDEAKIAVPKQMPSETATRSVWVAADDACNAVAQVAYPWSRTEQEALASRKLPPKCTVRVVIVAAKERSKS